MGYYVGGEMARDRAVVILKNIKENIKNESDVKKLTDTDKEIIKKVIDFVNSDKNKINFGKYWIGENSIFQKGKASQGTLLGLENISMDRIKKLDTPPRSSDFIRFFKRIANIFGRRGSKRLFQEITLVNPDRKIGNIQNERDRL